MCSDLQLNHACSFDMYTLQISDPLLCFSIVKTETHRTNVLTILMIVVYYVTSPGNRYLPDECGCSISLNALQTNNHC
jgi:hypothetical protein